VPELIHNANQGVSRGRILFTWELGQNSGHVLPALPILQALASEGHEICVALRDVRSLGGLLRSEGFTVLQAPALPDVMLRRDEVQPNSLADILAILGFRSSTALEGLLTAWMSLLQLVKPDVVVASYAPLSLFLARSMGIRTVVLAFPMEVPVRIHPQPPFPGKAPGAGASDCLILAALRTALSRVGISQLPSAVYELFEADLRVLMTFPEFDFIMRDHQRDGPLIYAGATAPRELSGAQNAIWPVSVGQLKIFATLHLALPFIDRIRETLIASPYSVFVVLAGATVRDLENWTAPNMAVTNQRVNLGDAIGQCDVALSYAGHSTVCAAAIAGKPQVLVPRDWEQGMTARCCVQLRLGVVPDLDAEGSLLKAIAFAAEDPHGRLARSAFCAAHTRDSNTTESVARQIAALARCRLTWPSTSAGCRPPSR